MKMKKNERKKHFAILIIFIFCIVMDSCSMLSVMAFGETLDRYGLADTQLSIPLSDIESLQIQRNFICRWSSERYFALISFLYPENVSESEVTRVIVEIAREIEFIIESEDGKTISSGAEIASLERIGPPHYATMGVRLSKEFFSMNWRGHYRIKIKLPQKIKKISKYKPVFLIGTLSVYYYPL